MRFKQFLKRKIASFLIVGSIALSSGCGERNVVSPITIDKVPEDFEISQIVQDVKTRYNECKQDINNCSISWLFV